QVFDHAIYERSKATVSASLFSTGYLDAVLERHRVEVSRSSNNAAIDLKWKAGQRYRLGTTHFDGGQFSDQFMQRYIPWQEGDFYSQTELLTFQQRLVDADYFSVAQVQPDTEHASDGVVLISVILAPAKRTIYTGGVFIGTDTGVGVRGGIERRWINKRGHKLKFETILAQRLKTLSTLYQIPLPGQDNHSWNFGVTYRDENTDTSQSKTFKIAANDSKIWKGWTRTWGLQFLTGDFKVADVDGKTTLLYPEASLSRKSADDFNFPRKGYSLTLAARAGQKGLLSDTSFAQVTADAKWIRGLGDNGRFIARGSLGYTQVGDFDKLPPELRFFAGGDRSIRGYAFQTVGPRYPLDTTVGANKVFGGKELIVASGEYEHYFTPTWGGAVFVDAGDAFSGTDFKLKVGTGVGMRWRSPVGMVRVDLGFPLRDSNASGVELHIVIGPDL
ncbi:MAG: autotransporter assembly complex family protein, partial [Dokdonella sp.]